MQRFPPVSLVGAPTDIGAGHRGASMGPEALRVAGLEAALRQRGLDVVDRGNLGGPLNPWTPPQAGYRHLVEVEIWNRQVMQAVRRELDDARLPILLGGDHCLAIGSITAVAQHCREHGKRLLVLWLDAHADFNTSAITPSGNIHGMPVACLCGLGPRELTELGGSAPAMLPSNIRQIGIRSVDADEKRLVRDHGLDIYDMRYIDEIGMKRVMEEALADIDDNTHEVTPSGNLHGMPVACLCGLGPEPLVRLGGDAPAIRPDQIRQIGIRSVDQGEKRLVKDYGLDIYDMRYIDEVGMKRAMEEALEDLDDDTHLHVSFDVDFLDPSIAPGVGTTVPGGPNYREAQLVMEMIADTGRMGSLDIVELNPALDSRNTTAEIAVDLVESLFGKSTLMRD